MVLLIQGANVKLKPRNPIHILTEDKKQDMMKKCQNSDNSTNYFLEYLTFSQLVKLVLRVKMKFVYSYIYHMIGQDIHKSFGFDASDS